MNILLVAHYFLPFSVGGVEEYTYLLARDLMFRGHQVHVFHGVIEADLEEYSVHRHEYRGIPCTHVSVDLDEIDDFSGTWRQGAVDRIFEALLDEYDFDLVHVQHLTRLSLGLIPLAKGRGLPVLWSLVDYWMQCARGQRVKLDGEVCHQLTAEECGDCLAEDIDFLDRRKPEGERASLREGYGTAERHRSMMEQRRREMVEAMNAADLLTTASEFTRTTYQEYGVEQTIEILPYGVDPALLNGYVESTADRLRLGFLGRLIPTKGVEVLIEAFRLVEGDAELVIHGFGEEGYTRELQERAGKAPITFAGPFTRSDYARMYRGFDVQVVPSTWLECSPLVIQTGFLFRKPMIVSRLGSLVELVPHDEYGLQFRPGDARDLATQIEELLSDRSILDRFRAKLPLPLSTVEHTDRVEEIYRRLIATP